MRSLAAELAEAKNGHDSFSQPPRRRYSSFLRREHDFLPSLLSAAAACFRLIAMAAAS